MQNTIHISYIIVTGSDAKFFELVKGTILSIREKPQGEKITIGFLDFGCNPEQIKWLEEYVNIIKSPEWDFDFPNQNTTPNYKKAYTSRPFLPKYFPNFDIYIWLDADTWLQNWSTIDLLIKGTLKRKGLTIVPELSLAYNDSFPYGICMVDQKIWLGKSSRWKYGFFQQYYGEENTQLILGYPILNSGVIALHREAPHWQKWQEALIKGINHCQASLFCDQSALMYAIYFENLFSKTEFLPSWCNWLMHLGLSYWDPENHCFVEPYLPYYPLGVIHLADTIKDIEVLALPSITNHHQKKVVVLRYQSKKISTRTF